VAGYGTTRALPRSSISEKQEDAVVRRLDTLFGRGELTAINFARLVPRKLGLVFEEVVNLLLARKGGLLPEHVGLALKGDGSSGSLYNVVEPKDGGPDLRRNEAATAEFVLSYSVGRSSFPVPASQGSQGHQATLAWVSDLIGQQLWDNQEFWLAQEDNYTGTTIIHDAEALGGLVLIDELDLHLHPSWQVNLISALKKVFPRLQFVATTHSPMLLPNLERDEIVRLRQSDDGDVHVDLPDISPALMTGSEIYDSFFGIDRLYPNELGEALQRYGYLAGNPSRSNEEDAEVSVLREKLRQHDLDPGWDPVPREGAA
jgi:AAA domain, putative AbiEii toxin, Type IV TA system